jgi:excisionase family DNA binding protein
MSATATDPEPLVKARVIRQQTNVPEGTIYRMARKKLIKSYRIGEKGGGVRFRVSEVLAALERLAETAGTAGKGA